MPHTKRRSRDYREVCGKWKTGFEPTGNGNWHPPSTQG